MIISRREVLIGTAAVAAAGILTAFPVAISESVHARSPLTPPPTIWVHVSDAEGLKPMATWFIWGEGAPQLPQRNVTALLNIYADLAAGQPISYDDLDALDRKRCDEANEFGWTLQADMTASGEYASHARAVCRWLDRAVSEIGAGAGRTVPGKPA
jgi:hypothetical protein